MPGLGANRYSLKTAAHSATFRYRVDFKTVHSCSASRQDSVMKVQTFARM
jgi:hypothetical protein